MGGVFKSMGGKNGMLSAMAKGQQGGMNPAQMARNMNPNQMARMQQQMQQMNPGLAQQMGGMDIQKMMQQMSQGGGLGDLASLFGAKK